MRAGETADVGGRTGTLPGRPLAAAALAVACAIGALAVGEAIGHAGAPAPVSAPAARSLPLALEASASRALGASDPAYAVRAAAGGLVAGNPAQHIEARFGHSGVTAATGAIAVHLSVRAIGRGATVTPVAPEGAPRAHANEVVYDRAGLAEWYANGPAGLEQGFTVARAPESGSGPLTLAVALSGNARPVAAPGGGVVFANDGRAAMRYDGLFATDARGHALHSWMELHGGSVWLRVDARGARYPLHIDPFLHQPILLEPVGATGKPTGLGGALAADGNTAVIGAAADGSGAGALFVFVRSGETWTQQGPKLTATEETGNSNMGLAVAMSADGNTIVAGGPNDSSQRGAAWVFARSGETWSQQGPKINGNAQTPLEEFGEAVAISGDGGTVLIGGRRSHENVGAGWVFVRSGESWTQQGERLTPSDETGEGQLGSSVALSGDGNTALLGAFHESSQAGAAWVFTRTGETWTQQGPRLTPGEVESTEKTPGNVGTSAALSSDGNTALIGGDTAGKGAGAVWAFTRSGETWTQQGPKLTGTGENFDEKNPEFFGAYAALSPDGNTALAGSGSRTWAFHRSGSTWSQQGGRLLNGPAHGLSEGGETALIGIDIYPPTPASEAPDIGRCNKAAATTAGNFATAACTTEKIGAFEWFRSLGPKTKFTTKITEGIVLLETVHATKLICSTEVGGGTYTSRKTVGGVTLIFTGCETSGGQCESSGAAAGEIVSQPLEGVLGVEKAGETHIKDKIALDLFPVGNAGPFAEFSCAGLPIVIRGSVLLPVLANKMALTNKLKFVAVKGKQKPERFVGGPADVLEMSAGGGAYEQIGLTLKLTQTNEEKLEINTVF